MGISATERATVTEPLSNHRFEGRPGIADLHRPRIAPVFLATLREPAIHADFRDTTPPPRPAACGADTGSPAQSWRTADDGSS
jgi:hypothetical protein